MIRKSIIIMLFIILMVSSAFSAQEDFNITTDDANTGATFRAAVNAALQALATQNSGDSAPSSPYPYQMWVDSLNNTVKMRNGDNDAWIAVGTIDALLDTFSATLTTATSLGTIDNISKYGCAGDGATDDSGCFNTAGASGKTILVTKPASSYKISANVSVDTLFIFIWGATTSIDSGKTITFSVQPWIDLYQNIFTGDGTIAVPEHDSVNWFGAVADNDTNSGTTNKAAIQKALNASDLTYVPSLGTYYSDAGLVFENTTRIVGSHKTQTIIKLSDGQDADLLTDSGSSQAHLEIEHLTLDGNKAENTAGRGLELDFSGAPVCNNVKLESMRIWQFAEEALYVDDCNLVTLYDVYITKNGSGIYTKTAEESNIINSVIEVNGGMTYPDYDVRMESSVNSNEISIENSWFETLAGTTPANNIWIDSPSNRILKNRFKVPHTEGIPVVITNKNGVSCNNNLIAYNSIEGTTPSINYFTFTSGSEKPDINDEISGATSGTTAYVALTTVSSGTWAGGDAAGTIYVHTIVGAGFHSSGAEAVDITGGNSDVMTTGSVDTSTTTNSFIGIDHGCFANKVEFNRGGTSEQLLSSPEDNNRYDGISDSGHYWMRRGRTFDDPLTLDDSGTPSVKAGNYFETGGTTTITDLDDGRGGQGVLINARHATPFDFTGTDLRGNGGEDFTAAIGDLIYCVMASNDTTWQCQVPNRYAPLEASFTYDAGQLSDGEGETHQVTVTGAEFGDTCTVAAPVDLQDMIATCYVQAADTVVVRLQNESDAAFPIDLDSGTWRVKLLK